MERFIPIPVRGFEHLEVSDLGRLRVPPREIYVARRLKPRALLKPDGRFTAAPSPVHPYRSMPGRDLTVFVQYGHRRCVLRSSFSHCLRPTNRDPMHRYSLGCEVAHLVLLAFRGYPANDLPLAIRRVNGDPLDDRLENLEWIRRTTRGRPMPRLPLVAVNPPTPPAPPAGERFVPIPVRGFDHIEVSDFGRLRSRGRDLAVRVLGGRRRCVIQSSLYRYFRPTDQDQPVRRYLNCEVAHLVLLAFKGYPVRDMPLAIHHVNGDPLDDRLVNLEWVQRTVRGKPIARLPRLEDLSPLIDAEPRLHLVIDSDTIPG
jgi:hypothetical protein